MWGHIKELYSEWQRFGITIIQKQKQKKEQGHQLLPRACHCTHYKYTVEDFSVQLANMANCHIKGIYLYGMTKIWNDNNSEAKAEERAGSPTVTRACHCAHYKYAVVDFSLRLANMEYFLGQLSCPLGMWGNIKEIYSEWQRFGMTAIQKQKQRKEQGHQLSPRACHCTHYMHTVKDLRYKKFPLCTDV